MPSEEGPGRLTGTSPDNHQAWLWFSHLFGPVLVILAGLVRINVKRGQFGTEDAALGVAHVFYTAYWIVVLLSLLNSLGKSEAVTTKTDVLDAARELFASRILFACALVFVKISTAILVGKIFTTNLKARWYYVMLGTAVVQLIVGILVISAGCSPDRILDPGENTFCSNNVARWTIFTVFEGILDILPCIPATLEIIKLQMTIRSKGFVIFAFWIRLIIFAPAWIHMATYAHFMRHGRPNIGIVPTVICEDFWVALALAGASFPVILRVSKKFTTGGAQIAAVTLATSTAYSKRSAAHKMNTTGSSNSSSQGRSQPPQYSSQKGPVLRPEPVEFSSSVQHEDKNRESTSIKSAPESQLGILREVRFEVRTMPGVHDPDINNESAPSTRDL